MKKEDLNIAHLKKIIKEAVKDALDELKQNENSSESFKIEDYWDLNSYSEEQIKSICTDLSVFIYGNNFGEPMQIVNGKLKIYESTTEYTLPYKDVKKELQKDFQFQNWQIKEQKGANGIKLILLLADIERNNKIIIEKMRLMGWEKANISQPSIVYGVPVRAISFDPIYQDSIQDIIRGWRFLYHISPIANKDSILKNGLIPYSKNNRFDYSPRVYLLKPILSDDKLRRIAAELYSADNSSNNDGTYCLFLIVVNNIPKDVDFFFVPRYENGIYTKQAIPSNAINGCHTFNIFNNNLYKL